MKKPLVYLASPYSSADPELIQARVEAVQEATAKLIEQGNLIFSPIVHSHPLAPLVSFSPVHPSEWMTYDKAFIDHCDEVWVLMLNGWEKSQGVSEEIAYAYDNNIPVRFVSFPEITISKLTYSAFNPYYTASHPALPHIRASRLENKIDQADEITPLGTYRNTGSVEAELTTRITEEEAQRIINYIFGDTKPKAETKYGAGKFYSPQSNGKPPVAQSSPTLRKGDICEVLPHDKADFWFGFDAGDTVEIMGEAFETPKGYLIECENIQAVEGLRLGQTTPVIALRQIEPNKTEPKQTIIGLNGYAQVGKDTVGAHLVEKHGFTRIGLADAVREAAYALNPVVGILADQMFDELDLVEFLKLEGTHGETHQVYFTRLAHLVDIIGWDRAKKFPSVRTTLQKIGTDAGRDIHGNTCWLYIARTKIEAAYPNPVVITDVRFENEAQFVRDLDGMVIQIRREGVGALNGHASEADIPHDLIDMIFINHGTITELQEGTDKALEILKELK